VSRRLDVKRAGLALVLVLALVLACKDAAPEADTRVDEPVTIERDDLRADAREGLELAIDDPGLARALERTFTQLASAPEVIDAAEKLLARVGREPRLEAPTAEFFATLQATTGMRAALAEYARANPELEVDAIAAGFVGHVDARLTRPELATRVELELGERLGAAGPVLGVALLREGGGVARLADRVADGLVAPAMVPALDQRLGRDPVKRADRLHRYLSDPVRCADLLLALAEHLRQAAGVGLLAGLLDDETLAPVFADALARVLEDDGFRDQAALAFEQAVAAELDPQALEREIDALLALPVIQREAAALLAELARLPSVRERIDGFVDEFAATPEFERALLDAVD
jgi:hypothetical protein